MSKRSNGEGSVRLRSDGRWEGRYNVQVGSATKRRSVFAKTKGEASSRLRAALTVATVGCNLRPRERPSTATS